MYKEDYAVLRYWRRKGKLIIARRGGPRDYSRVGRKQPQLSFAAYLITVSVRRMEYTSMTMTMSMRKRKHLLRRREKSKRKEKGNEMSPSLPSGTAIDRSTREGVPHSLTHP
jgi:hypothetical protein